LVSYTVTFKKGKFIKWIKSLVFEYIWLIIIIAMSSFLAIQGGYQGAKVALVLSSSILAIFSFFKYYSGNDYGNYAEVYAAIPPLLELTRDVMSSAAGEWGYVFINSVFKSLDVVVYVFIGTLSVVSIIIKSNVFFRLSLNPYICFVLYFSATFFSSEFVQYRWALALSFIFLAVFSLLKRNNYWAIFFVCIAISLHITSLIPAIILLIYTFFRLSSKSLIIMAVLTFCIGFSINIPLVFLDAISNFSQENYFLIKLIGYMGRADEPLKWNVLLRIVMTFVLVTTLFYKYQKELPASYNPITRNVFTLYILTLSTCFLFISFPVLASRLYLMCEFLSAILISNYLCQIKPIGFRKLALYLSALFSACLWWIFLDSAYRKGNVWGYNIWLYEIF